MAKIFVVDWKADECESICQILHGANHQVRCECEDGGRALKRMKDDPPDAAVIALTSKPSHGRQTADALRDEARLADVRLVFAGGDVQTIEGFRDAFPEATFTPVDRVAHTV